MNIQELKARAIKVEDQMKVYWPQFSSHEEVIDLKALETEDKKMQYSYNNSVIAFVDEKGDLYVIPDIGIQKILASEGYSRKYFYVPFSNWDYPIEYEEKWKELWKFKNKEWFYGRGEGIAPSFIIVNKKVAMIEKNVIIATFYEKNKLFKL